MTPSPTDIFWGHIPSWGWTLIIVPGILGFFLYQAIKASEGVATVFGTVGKHIHAKSVERAARKVNRSNNITLPGLELLQAEMSRVLRHMESLEKELARATDGLECATTFLVDDTHWHHEVDVILAEAFTAGTVLLPHRIPFSEFQRRWRDGWRPPASQED